MSPRGVYDRRRHVTAMAPVHSSGAGDEYRCGFCQIRVGSIRTLLAHEDRCVRRGEVEAQRAAVIRRFARKQRRWQAGTLREA